MRVENKTLTTLMAHSFISMHNFNKTQLGRMLGLVSHPLQHHQGAANCFERRADHHAFLDKQDMHSPKVWQMNKLMQLNNLVICP